MIYDRIDFDFRLLKMAVTEFVGSFFVTFITLVGFYEFLKKNREPLTVALMSGLAFTSLYFAWSKFSGAHFNPAISTSFMLANRMPFLLWIIYVIF